MSEKTFLPDFYYSPHITGTDSAAFYCPYIPLTSTSASSSPTVTFVTRYDNLFTIRGTVVRIENITDSKILELAEHIDFLDQIKHSNKSNRTILFKTTVENLVYLKLKGIIE